MKKEDLSSCQKNVDICAIFDSNKSEIAYTINELMDMLKLDRRSILDRMTKLCKKKQLKKIQVNLRGSLTNVYYLPKNEKRVMEAIDG